MSIDEFIRLILAISLSFAIIGVSYALIKLILSGSALIEDSRKPVQNIGDLSTSLVADYNSVKGIIANVSKIGSYLETPLKLFKFMNGFINKGSKEDKDL